MKQVDKRLSCIISNYIYFTINELIPLCCDDNEVYMDDLINGLSRDFCTQSYELFFAKDCAYKTEVYQNDEHYKEIKSFLCGVRNKDSGHIHSNDDEFLVTDTIFNGKNTGWKIIEHGNPIRAISLIEPTIIMMLKIYDEYFNATYDRDKYWAIPKDGQPYRMYHCINLLSKMQNNTFYAEQYIAKRVGMQRDSLRHREIMSAIDLTNKCQQALERTESSQILPIQLCW